MRYPSYRNYWLGLLASVTGFQIFRFSLVWMVFDITGSLLYLAYVTAAMGIPGIIFNLVGGVIADKLDKRRMVMTTQGLTGGLILLLATLTMQDAVQVWHIMIIAFLAGAVEAFDTPARQALYPALIDRSVMVSAVAMNSAIWQGTRIVAPAVAGFMIDLINLTTSFCVASAGFIMMAFVMHRLNVPRIEPGSRGNPAKDLLDGLNYVRKNSIFSILIGMTFFNSFFGMAYILLMPAFAADILQVDARGMGGLLGSGGVGSLLTTFYLGSRSNVSHRGKLIVGGAVLFGLTVAAFAITSDVLGFFPLALGLMFLAGVFNSCYMINIQSALQILVPDGMRGRVMGFYGMTWSIMPLGGFQAGALANFIGAPMAIAIGGLAVVVFAVGPALFNRAVLNLGTLLSEVESGPANPNKETAATTADN